MDTRPADGESTADAVARKMAETSIRCAAAHARAEDIVRRAQVALAAAQDRLRRAQAVHDAIRATQTDMPPERNIAS